MSTLRYRVHGITHQLRAASVEFEGETTQAQIPVMIVELAWDSKDGRDHGSLTMSFVGKDLSWARDTFVQDAEVDVSFTGPLNVPSAAIVEPTTEPVPSA